MRRSRRSEEAERRREPRRTAAGAVHLQECGMPGGAFTGELMDHSEHGFRVRHARLTLACGQAVNFEFGGRRGQACAMWTRIAGNEAESGFRVLD